MGAYMESTNRRWQSHLKSKGIIPFFLDRLLSHAMSSAWQYEKGAFYFPISKRERDDELTRAFFELVEKFPYTFYLELTNNCNLNCRMCARSFMARKKGFMTNALFRKIIDEIAEKQPYSYLHYYGIGESLLDPGLFKKLEYADKKGLNNSILFTNGQLLLDKDNYKRLVHSGVACVGVDLDGFSQRTYGQIRIGGNFLKVKRGIESLYREIRKSDLPVRVEIAYQIFQGINDTEITRFVNWCNKNDYEYKLVTMHSWGGVMTDIPKVQIEGLRDQHRVPKRKYPCCGLWSGFMIGWDGRVALCFQDADIRQSWGDINKQSIEEVWRGKHLLKRREHIQGKFTGLCRECDSFTNVRLPRRSTLYPSSLVGPA